jgi:PAS domain S-box-containing protein
MRVLLIDEGGGASEPLVRGALALRGHEVVVLDDSGTALGRLSEETFDLVALRWGPEEGEQPHLVQWLRAQPGGERACLLLIVAREHSAAVAETLPEGPVEFLFEPVDEEILPLRLLALERLVDTWATDTPPLDPQREQLATLLLEHAPVGLALLRGGEELLANDAFARMAGYAPEELRELGVMDARRLLHPDDRSALIRLARGTLESGRSRGWSRFRLLHKDGGVVWIEATSRTVETGAGPAAVVCYQDVSARPPDDEAREDGRQRLRSVLHALPVAVAAMDSQAGVVLWNREAERVSGRSEQVMVGNPRANELLFPDEEVRAQIAREWAERGERFTDWPVTIVRPDGEPRRVLWSAVGNPGGAGDFASLLVGLDVTEHYRQQEAMEESEQRFRTLLDSAPEAIVVLDADTGRFVEGNDNAARLFGVPRAELSDWGPGRLSPPLQEDGRPSDVAALAYIAEALDGGAPVFDWLHLNRSGDVIPCELRLVRLPTAGRNLLRGSITDIRWRRRAEEQHRQLEEALQHGQKMEAVGRLAGGVAHDFNNLLTGILACSAELAYADDLDAVREAAATIERAADRAAELTKQLLGFARRGKYMSRPTAIDDVLGDVMQLLGRTVDKRIHLVHVPAPRGATVSGDPGQLQQVFLNLALNARDAMREGGTLTIRASHHLLDEAEAAQTQQAIPGAWLAVAVQDTGGGIPDDVLPHLFEPFFTTKPAGEGTGMGLAMVYGIVRNHSGWVDVDTGPDGTTFTVWLPWSDAPAERSGPHEPVSTGSHAPPIRVLVVDDEPVVRRTLDSLLGGLGWVVTTCESGEEAVAWFAANHDDVDAVVVDMIMPGMDGQECFRRLRAIDPDVRAVLSTGYGLDAAVRSILAEGMRGFVQKPYRIAQLTAAIEKAMKDE